MKIKVFCKSSISIVLVTVLLGGIIGISQVSDSLGMKSEGKSGWKYGSAMSNIVCGDRLCSEFPNGRAGYLASVAVSSQKTKPMTECQDEQIPVMGVQCTKISGTTITQASVIEQSNSIIIKVDPYNGGTLVLDLSQKIISGVFMVLIDGQEWRDYYMVGDMVTINFPWATETIELISEKV